MFSKNVRTLYFYIVAFISLIIVVSSFIATVGGIAGYIYPVNYNYNYYFSSTEKIAATEGNVIQPTEEEINAQNQIQAENEKNTTLKNILTSFALFVISVPLYCFHWRAIQKDRSKKE